MIQTGASNPWSEINGGMRGSVLLSAGAIITVLATLQNFSTNFITEVPGALVASAWLCWIMALWLLAAGFFWVGIHPFMGRLGLAVGGFHFLNGLFLLVIIFAQVPPFLPNASLAIGRSLLLLFFVMVEKKHLRPLTVSMMMIAACLHFLKISLRIMEVLPTFGKVGDNGLDTGLLVLLAVAIILLGKDIKIVENSWAQELASNRVSGFDEFNNPEHEWNIDKE